MKSPKEISIERKLLSMTEGKTREIAEFLINDPEVHCLQEYANTVSIKRLNYNDHGPVHMCTTTLNAMVMAGLLRESSVPMSLEREEVASYDDSRAAVFMAAFLHDIGMGLGRQNHENNSVMLAKPVIERALLHVYPDSLEKRVILRAVALEGIFGHMATQRIHSIEAGLILVADGCDMEKGRARIPMLLNLEPKVGDIHQYSAAAIEKVTLERGKAKPIRIVVEMKESVGFFQVEEVLSTKISMSPVKPFIELAAFVQGQPEREYL